MTCDADARQDHEPTCSWQTSTRSSANTLLRNVPRGMTPAPAVPGSVPGSSRTRNRQPSRSRGSKAAPEEILVFGDDDDDLPAAQVQVAGATADPVKDYLKQIGKVPLLNAEQEVELAKRIEAGRSAEEKLADGTRLHR